MTHEPSQRDLLMALCFLAGAAVAVFITGTEDIAAMAAVSMASGVGLLIGRMSSRPSFWPAVLAVLFLAASATALWPPETLPAWRAAAPESLKLGESWATMPPQVWFWWLVLAGTITGGFFLLAAPLTAQALRWFLHAVAAVTAVYAMVSIADAHTSWSWPYTGRANFGLLPNRNHTATLLVVGSIISFGLMQWEVAKGYRVGAAVSALCGAPSLAALLFFSTSRAGAVFLVVGFLIWAVGAAGTAVPRRTMLSAAGVLAAFLMLLVVVGGSAVRDRLVVFWGDIMAAETGEASTGLLDFRQAIFQDTIPMIEDASWTGQGLGHFEFVFPHYREASRLGARVLHPESDWLMVAAETGLPSVVILLVLAGWFFQRCWGARCGEGGLLRWTVASAIGAALAHGLIDVPWHRPALGWFLLVVALAAVPDSARPLRFPLAWRLAQILAGAALLAAAGSFMWAAQSGRTPLAYRWNAYEAELGFLAEARKFEAGEALALEAIRDFPLQYKAHYWWAGFLRTFEETEAEMHQAMAAGRFAEPVLPSVAADQARLWVGLSEELEAEARMEAIRRARKIEEVTGRGGAAAGELEKGLRAAQDRPAVQVALREQLQDQPVMLAHWVRLAKPELVEEYLSGLGSGAGVWLDSLPPDLREQVLGRWITLPSAVVAVEYMEGRGGAGVYGRPLANFCAKAGDKERAVRIVAEAEGVDLRGRAGWGSGEWGRQVADLQAQGNEVAVRRLVNEAVTAKDPEAGQLAAAMAWAAERRDWETAWRAASRLVSATKKGQ